MFSKHTFGARTYSPGLARTGEHHKEPPGSWGPPLTKQWAAFRKGGRPVTGPSVVARCAEC